MKNKSYTINLEYWKKRWRLGKWKKKILEFNKKNNKPRIHSLNNYCRKNGYLSYSLYYYDRKAKEWYDASEDFNWTLRYGKKDW